MGHRLSRIVTRTGDAGTTGLGDGSRVSKGSARIAVLSNGQLVAVFDRDEATEDAIIAASAKGHGHQGKLAS